MVRSSIHPGRNGAALIVGAAIACAAPSVAQASVIVPSVSTEATYSGTVASYNFQALPPYVGDKAVVRDRSGEHLPEPATWAMMILGFFGLSFAVRRPGRRASKVRVRYN